MTEESASDGDCQLMDDVGGRPSDSEKLMAIVPLISSEVVKILIQRPEFQSLNLPSPLCDSTIEIARLEAENQMLKNQIAKLEARPDESEGRCVYVFTDCHGTPIYFGQCTDAIDRFRYHFQLAQNKDHPLRCYFHDVLLEKLQKNGVFVAILYHGLTKDEANETEYLLIAGIITEGNKNSGNLTRRVSKLSVNELLEETTSLRNEVYKKIAEIPRKHLVKLTELESLYMRVRKMFASFTRKCKGCDEILAARPYFCNLCRNAAKSAAYFVGVLASVPPKVGAVRVEPESFKQAAAVELQRVEDVPEQFEVITLDDDDDVRVKSEDVPSNSRIVPPKVEAVRDQPEHVIQPALDDTQPVGGVRLQTEAADPPKLVPRRKKASVPRGPCKLPIIPEGEQNLWDTTIQRCLSYFIKKTAKEGAISAKAAEMLINDTLGHQLIASESSCFNYMKTAEAIREYTQLKPDLLKSRRFCVLNEIPLLAFSAIMVMTKDCGWTVQETLDNVNLWFGPNTVDEAYVAACHQKDTIEKIRKKLHEIYTPVGIKRKHQSETRSSNFKRVKSNDLSLPEEFDDFAQTPGDTEDDLQETLCCINY